MNLVLNFDLPKLAEDYVHRVGRTARAGKGKLFRALYVCMEYILNIHAYQCLHPSAAFLVATIFFLTAIVVVVVVLVG